MAEQWPGGPDWTQEAAASDPPPTVPFVVPPPPQAPPPAPYPPYPPYSGYPPGYQVGYQPLPYPAAYPMVMDAPKSKIAAGLLAFFVGALGIHNFYLGRNGLGIAQLLLATVGGLFTCGLATMAVAIWAFVEGIVILCGGVRDRYGRPLV